MRMRRLLLLLCNLLLHRVRTGARKDLLRMLPRIFAIVVRQEDLAAMLGEVVRPLQP